MSEREILGPLYGLNGSFLLLTLALAVALAALVLIYLNQKG